LQAKRRERRQPSTNPDNQQLLEGSRDVVIGKAQENPGKKADQDGTD
jgi:hypothetical protein